MSCVSSSSSVISKDISFTAPLIHRSSPESPFYNPNATQLDIIKASLRISSTRAKAFSNLKTNKNISGSIKFPVPTFEQLIKNEYVIRYRIGSPPMETYGAADTASSLTWLQCVGCEECYLQPIDLFDPSTSSTYNPVLCGSDECNKAAYTDECSGAPQEQCCYSTEYEDEAYSYGDIATETFTFPDTGSTTSNNGNNLDISHKNIIFGCGFKNKDVDGSSPGIVGLSNHRSSLVGQLGLTLFSYCVPADINIHGQMRFGSAAIISRPTTKLAPNEESLYYFQNVDGLYVDGEKVEGIPDDVFKFVEGEPGGFLIDTGTTYTQFPSTAFDPLMEKLKEKMQSRGMEPIKDVPKFFELCYDMKYRYTGYLPTIEIRFTDSIMPLMLSNDNAWLVMPSFSSGDPQYFCLAMDDGEDDDTSVLGMHQMRDLNVGIDLQLLQVSFFYNTNCPQYQ
ncbi:hypothetical protein Dsin_008110 [Dipteronia sinensis]|uniref:Peptidase A1 domain-containing protein n=1 Tax=Dipteronia sinensis TaxID=43782 RepID=A0AAE0EH50_9ROSI|nr:hypothetical protein Dsin_008110 [Dipteronia sinensis]